MNKNSICFVRAKLKDDYVFDGIAKYGFQIHIPYKDYNIFLRLMREVWFRLHLPHRDFWYNKKITSNVDTYIFLDPLMTKGVFEYIHKKNPQARMILMYENRADGTISPVDVPKYVEKWSYDRDDCQKYSMNFLKPYYLDVYSFDGTKEQKKNDILYLGRNKGRLSRLLDLQNKFNKMELKTNFHICANRSFQTFTNKNYKKVVSYSEYLQMLKQSKALLNIAREDQVCITQRELEAAFDGIKCITTNPGILDFELYDESRYFLLTSQNIEEVPNFLNTEFKKIDPKLLEHYKYECCINRVLEGN